MDLSCSAVACIRFYTGVSGTELSALKTAPNYPSSPSYIKAVTTGFFEIADNTYDESDNAVDYGAVLEGYVKAPETGKYRFSTFSGGSSEVWVAKRSGTKEGLVKVVSSSFTGSSITGTVFLTLVEGQSYYITGELPLETVACCFTTSVAHLKLLGLIPLLTRADEARWIKRR